VDVYYIVVDVRVALLVVDTLGLGTQFVLVVYGGLDAVDIYYVVV
jgi:hypothetical protein